MAAWLSFYVMVGSSGAALIGIQFVVLTLVANRRTRPPADTVNAFGTPTVVHFTSVLLLSALMSAPWPSLGTGSAVAIMVVGVGGVGYEFVVARSMRRQTFYTPVWQDWLWYVVFPSSAYLSLALAVPFLRGKTSVALFVVAAATLVLLLSGVHNAWDSVTHIITGGYPDDDSESS